MAAITTATMTSKIGGRMITKIAAGVDADQKGLIGGTSDVFMAEVDNTANTSTDCYFKIYNVAAPTFGSNAPDFIGEVRGGAKRTFTFLKGMTFATDLSFCVVTLGGTTGNSALSGVNVRIITS
jgi:hypothetical protein|tara:strand:- start:1247 stop:1618 length:372 start_codon:yes stop_codon:yes gene_type:complete